MGPEAWNQRSDGSFVEADDCPRVRDHDPVIGAECHDAT